MLTQYLLGRKGLLDRQEPLPIILIAFEAWNVRWMFLWSVSIVRGEEILYQRGSVRPVVKQQELFNVNISRSLVHPTQGLATVSGGQFSKSYVLYKRVHPDEMWDFQPQNWSLWTIRSIAEMVFNNFPLFLLCPVAQSHKVFITWTQLSLATLRKQRLCILKASPSMEIHPGPAV